MPAAREIVRDRYARLRAGMGLRQRAIAVLAVLALTIALTERDVERYGDNIQIALPLVAWGCAALNGSAAEYAWRFIGTMATVHTIKRASGDAEWTQRPGGGLQGMPSGHTAAATFGASSLVQECVRATPVVGGVVVIAAGFVGVSRVEAEKHDAWQVLWGGLIGWAGERILRRSGPARTAAARQFSRIGGVLATPFRLLGRAARQVWRRLVLPD